jgi:hypothetical protein
MATLLYNNNTDPIIIQDNLLFRIIPNEIVSFRIYLADYLNIPLVWTRGSWRVHVGLGSIRGPGIASGVESRVAKAV